MKKSFLFLILAFFSIILIGVFSFITFKNKQFVNNQSNFSIDNKDSQIPTNNTNNTSSNKDTRYDNENLNQKTSNDVSNNTNNTTNNQSQNQDTQNKQNNTFIITNEQKIKYYSLNEVQKHNSKESCWTIIKNYVYDLTEWIDKHPGGADKILSLCGKDGTKSFVKKHSEQEKPERILEEHKIGELKE